MFVKRGTGIARALSPRFPLSRLKCLSKKRPLGLAESSRNAVVRSDRKGTGVAA